MAHRNWNIIEKFYKELLLDIYEQPEDCGHTELAGEDMLKNGFQKLKSNLF